MRPTLRGAAAALALLAACSGDGPTLSEVVESTSTTAPGPTTTGAPAAGGELPDACALLDLGQTSSAIGVPLDSIYKPPPAPIAVTGTTRTIPARSCTFTTKSADDVTAVTVRVGRPGDELDRLINLMADHGERIVVEGAVAAVLQVNANTVWGVDGSLLVSIQASYQGGALLRDSLPELLRMALEQT